MQSVKVKRTELLSKLKHNRDNHRQLFLKAQEGYRQVVIEELDAALEDARRGKELKTYIALQAPQDHTEDYDTVITMLEMSVDENIEITQQHFQCYVMDKWNWSQAVRMVNSTYAAGGSVAG